ncbi:hypothetical protein B9T24_15730 [Acinetobacter sp. ANC 4654]|uniref:NgoBV family restriction endonuclease n=1 Tax=Acinetobacter sp. ANC 4654 TaxID=1977872 RepID=UPI000A35027A|nr:NgoBV family restriction endonuclease [Acinetobacter sp. ANC 4654]OTG91763.1 hypothetical protein B9T24_15730 [Acinetobacter sp. ANC 4654]
MLHTQIVPLLQRQGLIGSSVTFAFTFLGVNVEISNKDVIGGLLEDWFGNWMTANNIGWNRPANRQKWPDFILANGKDLEFKSFDGTAAPNFDLANFNTYIRSLLTEPERLDTDHIIVEYSLASGGVVTITNFWVKKIWEMTGPSAKNILNLQVKDGVVTNIRPKNWRSSRAGMTFFTNRRDFVIALDQALTKFRPQTYPNWFTTVEQEYLLKTGQVL